MASVDSPPETPTTPANGRSVRAYIDFAFKWRWLVLIGTLGIGVLAASGTRFIEFKNDYQYFFREDNPQLRAFEDLQDIYSKSDNTLIVVAPDSGEVFQADTAARIDREMHSNTRLLWSGLMAVSSSWS